MPPLASALPALPTPEQAADVDSPVEAMPRVESSKTIKAALKAVPVRASPSPSAWYGKQKPPELPQTTLPSTMLPFCPSS